MVCRSFTRWFMALALVLTGTAVSSLSAQQFIRADANTNGAMNLDDVIYISAYLYSDGPAPMVLDRVLNHGRAAGDFSLQTIALAGGFGRVGPIRTLKIGFEVFKLAQMVFHPAFFPF